MSRPLTQNNNPPEPVELPMTIAEMARKTGVTESTMRWYISSGQWRDGEHYSRRGRRIKLIPSACAKFWTESTK